MNPVTILISRTSAVAWSKRVAGVLKTHLHKRVGVAAIVRSAGKALPTGSVSILLDASAALDTGEESYEICTERDNGSTQYVIRGVSRGLLYGVGRLLREIRRTADGVAWPVLNVHDTPQLELRGIYFPMQTCPVSWPNDPVQKPAVPFNAYTVWLLWERRFKDFENYLLELMLWGMNLMGVWYAEWMDEPWGDSEEARRNGSAYKRAIEIARSWRMKVCLITCTNTVPTAVAQKFSHAETRTIPRGLWNQFENSHLLCPSYPEVRKYLLEHRRKLAEFFQPDWMEVFPTDAGGCDCDKCVPWEPNYYKLAEDMLRPLAKSVPLRSINFWYFWNRDARKLAAKARESSVINAVSTQNAWQESTADRLKISDALAKRGKKIIFWPDITMIGGWGTYGTFPFIKGLHELFRLTPHVHGALPYSEGRYDDINKFTMLSLAWRPQQSLPELTREVLEGMYNESMPSQAVDAVLALEQRDFDRTRKGLAGARRKLSVATTEQWRWYSLEYYARHADVEDLGRALRDELQSARQKLGNGGRASTRQLAQWGKRLAALVARLDAAHKEMPTLEKKVNDFRRPYRMFCGTMLRERQQLLAGAGLDEASKLLAELRGEQVTGQARIEDRTQTLNVHATGKKKRRAVARS